MIWTKTLALATDLQFIRCHPNGATLSDNPVPGVLGNRGVVYKTYAQLKTFAFKPWGLYDVIGFLGESYFAGYNPMVTATVANAGER